MPKPYYFHENFEKKFRLIIVYSEKIVATEGYRWRWHDLGFFYWSTLSYLCKHFVGCVFIYFFLIYLFFSLYEYIILFRFVHWSQHFVLQDRQINTWAITFISYGGRGRRRKNKEIERESAPYYRSCHIRIRWFQKEDCRLDSADLQYLIKRFGLRLRNSESIHFEVGFRSVIFLC